jgi:oxygen-independent coproporphyrinogen-3 oxidase
MLNQDHFGISLDDWNIAVPRYTSYPTAPQFHSIEETVALAKLKQLDRTNKPLSLYFHIPFCKTMCLFCGCSVVLNRRDDVQQEYVDHLLAEITMIGNLFSQKKVVQQIHFGGGTPTSLTEMQLQRIMEHIRSFFIIGPHAEVSMEVDPRTVFMDQGRKLYFLKKLGFNRISFGVQDLDPKVQEAVRRRQTEEMTVSTYWKAREIGFQGINIDLIYGLPFQTVDSFQKTAQKLVELKPDRIAFYSYAKIPWLKLHQKAIPEETLPSLEEKFNIYVQARQTFLNAGYLGIGMDHFATKNDSMGQAFLSKNLTRNFQGYAVQAAEDMIGFGVTSIGFIEGAFFQNEKGIAGYQQKITAGSLPIAKGFILSEDDQIRRFVIQSIMCHFMLDKRAFLKTFEKDFDTYFAKEQEKLNALQVKGFLKQTKDEIRATSLGSLFIRIIASTFDAYLHQGKFSRAV